jgi:hypothetical protein
MANLSVTFKSVRQQRQMIKVAGGQGDMMVSEVSADFEIGGKTYPMKIELTQPYGTDYESEPAEVGAPKGGYPGPIPAALPDQVEAYYRRQIGARATGGIVIVGCENAKMTNNFVDRREGPFVFEVDGAQAGGWLPDVSDPPKRRRRRPKR